ncbi:MAG: cobalamin-dependent protein [Desulfobacterium sp.]|nr:cobalamin-dependent protein [Desulfobacterium sp.]
MSKEILTKLADAVVAMDNDRVKVASGLALAADLDPLAAIQDGLCQGMKQVGRLYASGAYFIPELVCCAETLDVGLGMLAPHVPGKSNRLKGRIVMGVVEGDTHDIGKNILAMLLKAEGYEVIDLGRDVPLGSFVDKALEQSADVIALTSLMTTTREGMATVIHGCHHRGGPERPKVVVGGAAITESFARRIGADGYAPDALAAVEMINQLIRPDKTSARKTESLLEYVGGAKHRMIMPWMSTIGLRLTGYELYEVYQSPEKQLEVARVMDREYDADFVYPMDYGKIFCDALNIPMMRPLHNFPSVVENPIKNEAILSAYKIPDPDKDGPMPAYMEGLRVLAQNFDKPMMLSVEGPFTLAMELAGATDFARAIIRKPDFVEKMLEFTVKTVLTYVRSAVTAGAKLIVISEPSAIMMSPQRFEQLVSPGLRRIYGGFDGWKALHICGDSTHLLTQLLDCGAECLSLDQLVDIPAIAPQIPPDVVICGNIDPLGVLMEKTPDEVRGVTLSHLRQMRQYPNYMLSFGCDCLPDTPLDNLKAVMETGHTPLSELWEGKVKTEG